MNSVNPYVSASVKCAACGETGITPTSMLRVCQVGNIKQLMIQGYHEDILNDDPDILPVCGRECAQKLVEKFLTDWRLD